MNRSDSTRRFAGFGTLLKAFWSVYFKPEKARRLGGVLNGQMGRQKLLLDLCQRFRPEVVVETGAHRGVTTKFFAQTFRVPTLACEIDPSYCWEARWRTLALPHCRIFCEDTRHFLGQLRLRIPSEQTRILLYLDAHWDPRDLPLLGELDAVRNQLRHALILIDDFRHPHDPGYGFDEYDHGTRLELALLRKADPAFQTVFFPALPSSQESGMKRGSAYLGLGQGRDVLEACPGVFRVSATDIP